MILVSLHGLTSIFKWKRQNSGWAREAATCNAGIPAGRRFVCQLLYFQSAPCWYTWKSSRRWSLLWAFCTNVGDLNEALGFSMAPFWLPWPSGEWTSSWKSPLSLFLLFSIICLSNKNVDILKIKKSLWKNGFQILWGIGWWMHCPPPACLWSYLHCLKKYVLLR